jgi:secreted trypsin-like serine protease
LATHHGKPATMGALTNLRPQGSNGAMRVVLAVSVLLSVSLASASAMVGGASEDGAGRSVVTIVGSRGTFCSGALIAPDLVLSAAHCIAPGTAYKLVLYDAQRQPLLLDVKHVTTHPQFNAQSILAHRASADVALLQLAKPIPKSKVVAAQLGVPAVPISAGNRFVVAGMA